MRWTIDQYDYGLRIYDAQMGRFISRDPLGEAGGMNLYAAVGNDPVNKWDYLGLDTYDEAMRRKEEEIAKANCASMPDHYWIRGQCVYLEELEPYQIRGTGLGALSQAGWMNLWGGDRGYNPGAGGGNGGTGSPHNGPNGNGDGDGGGGGPEPWDAGRSAGVKGMINRISRQNRELIHSYSEFNDDIELVRDTAYSQILVGTVASIGSLFRSVLVAPFRAATRSTARSSAKFTAVNHGPSGTKLIQPRLAHSQEVGRQAAGRARASAFKNGATSEIVGSGAVFLAGQALNLAAADGWSIDALNMIDGASDHLHETINFLQGQQKELQGQYVDHGCEQFE